MAARGYQVEDLFKLKVVGDPQISPDGRRIAYTVQEIDPQTDGYRTAIWVTEEGAVTRQLTFGGRNDSSPRWSPDGRVLAFLSNRAGGSAQIYLIPMTGGDAYRLTEVGRGIMDFAWSPQGDAIAFTSRTGGVQANGDRQPPRVITSFNHKQNGQGFFDGSHPHIFVVNVAGGQPRQITEGDWDDGQLAYSPDGTTIAFISARHETSDRDNRRDVWVVPVAGGEARSLTSGEGGFAAPAFSPDGKNIAFTGVGQVNDTSGRNSRLWVMPVTGGEPRNLTARLDRGLAAGPGGGIIQWSTDGGSIFARVQDKADIHLYRFSVEDGSATRVLNGERVIGAFSIASNGTVAALSANQTSPAEVIRTDVAGSEEVKVSNANDALLAELRFPDIEPVQIHTADGATVEGWVIKPLDMEPGKKYPLVLDMHGGPYGAFQHQFQGSYQLSLPTQGCGVLQMNPRGSVGWGEAFSRYLNGGRGERDYVEQMAAVDAVISQGWVDTDRLGVTGYSYGGYMTEWIVTQTDRFKAAVAGAGVSNLYTMFSHSNSPVARYDEMGGDPWSLRDLYLKLSPISHVQNAKTPILLMHGEADLQCNTIQSDDFFTALKYHGVEVVYVRYPGEHHGFRGAGKPSNRLDYDERLMAWFGERLSLSEAPAKT